MSLEKPLKNYLRSMVYCEKLVGKIRLVHRASHGPSVHTPHMDRVESRRLHLRARWGLGLGHTRACALLGLGRALFALAVTSTGPRAHAPVGPGYATADLH